jgi:hypothetical protein
MDKKNFEAFRSTQFKVTRSFQDIDEYTYVPEDRILS